MANKNQQEEIITKEDINTNENIMRVDNRPGSIYSIVIFVLVFLAVYLFYPQISMLLPTQGEKLTVKMGYKATAITEMLDAKAIIVATVKEESKSKTTISSDNSPIVYRFVSFNEVSVLKGDADENTTTIEYGGKGLFQNGGTKKKYNVVYENTAEYDEGKTYLIFLDENYEAINGRAGALLVEDNSVTDAKGNTYTIQQVKDLLKEAQ